MVTLDGIREALVEAKEVLTDIYCWLGDRKDDIVDGYNDMSATDLHRSATGATLIDIIGVVAAGSIAGPVGAVVYGATSAGVNTLAYLGAMNKAEEEGFEMPEPIRMEEYTTLGLAVEVPKRIMKAAWNPYD